jgi:hypothetical protein
VGKKEESHSIFKQASQGILDPKKTRNFAGNVSALNGPSKLFSMDSRGIESGNY